MLVAYCLPSGSQGKNLGFDQAAFASSPTKNDLSLYVKNQDGSL